MGSTVECCDGDHGNCVDVWCDCGCHHELIDAHYDGAHDVPNRRCQVCAEEAGRDGIFRPMGGEGVKDMEMEPPPESMHVVRINVDSVVPLPQEWPPSVVWLRFLDEDLRELPASEVPPVCVDLAPLLRPEGGEQVLTVPAIPPNTMAFWSFWDAEQGGRLLIRQEREEDDLLTGIVQFMAWLGLEDKAMRRSAQAPVTISVGSTNTFEFYGGIPEPVDAEPLDPVEALRWRERRLAQATCTDLADGDDLQCLAELYGVSHPKEAR